MSDDKTPEQKIQALFFQSLQPASSKLKPSDIVVTITPLPEIVREAAEDERIDAVVARNTGRALEMFGLRNVANVEIDLSKTEFAKHSAGMAHGLIDMGGMWSSKPGVVMFRGLTTRFDDMKVKDVQRALAISLSLPLYKESNHLVGAFAQACRGRSPMAS